MQCPHQHIGQSILSKLFLKYYKCFVTQLRTVRHYKQKIDVRKTEVFLFYLLGVGEVEVPDQSHQVGEQDPVLGRHEVDVDDLRDGPDLPVGEQRGDVVLPDEVCGVFVGVALQSLQRVEGEGQECRREDEAIGQDSEEKVKDFFL